jgi:Alkylmercury lyase
MKTAHILLGRGQTILTAPEALWKGHLAQLPAHSQERLSFMTGAHHQIRYLAVRELGNRGRSVEPAFIAEQTGLPLEKVNAILAELERNLFFLVRNEGGAVAWAFPLTVEPTPHRLYFSYGERLYGAWAEDALAAPFVQGHLRKQNLTATIYTACAHSQQPITLTVSSAMQITVHEAGAEPLVFMPDLDWEHFSEPTIRDAYWRNSIFFWSEEHARKYRLERNQIDGLYLTLEQAAYAIPITQAALFAFGGQD